LGTWLRWVNQTRGVVTLGEEFETLSAISGERVKERRREVKRREERKEERRGEESSVDGRPHILLYAYTDNILKSWMLMFLIS
jgi:hypothetical protein